MDKDILVVGSGGNGQTTVMKMLRSLGFTTNSLTNDERIKHLFSPTSNYMKGVSAKLCIFVHNNSFDSVCSHYRRGWGNKQFMTLGNRSRLKASQIKNVDKYFKLVEEKNRDMYSIKYQYTNWYNNREKLPFPVYFLNFGDYREAGITGLAKVLKLFTTRSFTNEQLTIPIVARHKYADIKERYPAALQIYQAFDEKVKESVSISNTKLLST